MCVYITIVSMFYTKAYQSKLCVKHMHGASLATARAGLFAKELGHDLASRNALGKSVNVIAVGRGDIVILAEACLDHTCRAIQKRDW